MINLEEIIKTVTSDLRLKLEDESEFKNQFMQLFICNLLITIPNQYQSNIKDLLNDDNPSDQKAVVEKLISMGISREEAAVVSEESVRKSLSEVIEEYSDVLSAETKQKLQKYL